MAIGHVATGNVVPYTNAGSTTIAAGTVVEFAAMIGVAVGDIPCGRAYTHELALNPTVQVVLNA